MTKDKYVYGAHHCWTHRCVKCDTLNKGCVSFNVKCYKCNEPLDIFHDLDLSKATWGFDSDATQRKWDIYFLRMAKLVSERSKDPSTKCGAVIVDKDRRVLSTGYNGFAKGVLDRPEWLNDRPTKLAVTLHAEINSILFAERSDLIGCTMYTCPFQCCSMCAAVGIQKGIRRYVFPPMTAALRTRWGDSVILARQQFADVNAELVELALEE